MAESQYGWWRRHGVIVALLLSAFTIAIAVRTLFMAQVIEIWGPLNVYGGGSDSFYHSRVASYIILNHQNLVRDTSLNYPLGAVNPREPLFDWMNAILGILFAPLFGGSAVTAGAWFLSAQGPIWAALGVFPVYLIGREVSGRRVGIVGAFLYPLMVANIDSSTFGYANYLAFYTFFILLAIYGYLRTIKAVGSRRWVTSYRDPKAIRAGLMGFLRTERNAVKWAVFTGVAFGALALAWQGYTFFVATVVIFLVFALIVERIRKVDSFGLYVSTWIVALIGFPMAFPYYIAQGLFAGWFDLPLLLFFGALLVVLPFIMLRDQPWVISVPILAGVGLVAVGILDVFSHAAFINIITGQGYFVKTLVYSTVAEAQAPSIDQLILGYGVVTFFLAFVGLALFILGTIRARFKRVQMLFIVFAIISIYLPISAAKFFFLGSAAFALLPAEAIVRALDVGGYSQLRRNAASLSDRRGQLAGFRRAFKVRHVLIILLVLVIVTPNVWYALDAGVPYNDKTQFNLQVYNTLPPPLRTSPQNSSSFYLGAAGTELDTPDQYDEGGYDWLAQQDQNLPEPQRPAFVSWWDYGFQAVAEGAHPTVADNFQNGIDPAGNFLLSQNESLAIGVLATRLLSAEATDTGQPYLPPALNAILRSDGVNVTELHTLLANTSTDVGLVEHNPQRYLPVNPSNLDPANAMYDAVSYFLASTLSESGVVQVYDAIQSYTGWSIRYAMVDSRLFPTSGSSTGIFYAPADLTDRQISAGGVPVTYFQVTVTGSDGNTYSLGTVPSGITAAGYNINYYAPFYDSMIYRIFSGYNGTDVGGSAGIPGLTATSDPVEPAWMLQHFQVVYRTAYYCPYPDPASHPNCYRAANAITAAHDAKIQNGSLDEDPALYYGTNGGGGEAILEYYPGQPMIGTVQLPSGTPVSNARVTVYDAWGIPHMTTVTGADGGYSVILPPGNDTVNVTTGTLNPIDEAGSTDLLSFHMNVPDAVGLSPNAPTLVRNIGLRAGTVQGFLYWNAANNSSFLPPLDSLVSGATAVLWGSGTARTVTTDASGAFVLANVAPGVYNFSVRYQGSNFTEPMIYLKTGETYNATAGLTPGAVSGKVFLPIGGIGARGASITVTGANGAVAHATTNTSGEYRISDLGTGNYTVSASLSSGGLGAPAASVRILAAGQKLVQNFTLSQVTSVSVIVLNDGNPVAGIPVRFSPLNPLGTSLTNTSGGPPKPNATQPSGARTNTNSTLVMTDASGVAAAILPAGNYSVYALGLVGSQLEGGFSAAYLPIGLGQVELAPLALFPTVRLSGIVEGGVGSLSSDTVYAFNAQGASVSTRVNASNGYALYLPQGTYSLLGVQTPPSTVSPQTAAQQTFAGLANATLSYPTTVNLILSPATTISTRVGAITFTNGPGFYPASGAQVELGLSTGWRIAELADANGTATFAVPTAIPSGTTYCLYASAVGFAPASHCGLSPSDLSAQSELPLQLVPVSINLTVSGLPTGQSITVNFTAETSTAKTVNATGGPSFHLSLAPGTYGLTAWGPAPLVGGLLRQTTAFNVTLPLGTSSTSLNLSVLRQVSSRGGLILPPLLTTGSVVVDLRSPTLGNYSVSGSSYESGFYAPPGDYAAYAAGVLHNGSATATPTTFTALGSITINATGAISPTLLVTSVAARLTGNLTLNGVALNSTGAIHFDFLAPGSISIAATANQGLYTGYFPPNLTYTPIVSTTQLLIVGGVDRYETLTASAGDFCSTDQAVGYCDVPVTATVQTTKLSGSLTLAGYPDLVPGSLELIGPLPSLGVTTIAAPNGSFSVTLVPGQYQLYASSGGTNAALANLSLISVSASSLLPLDVVLVPTWAETVTVFGAPGTTVGPVTLNVTGPDGSALTLYDLALSVPQTFRLAPGLYTLTASASASPYGVTARASAETTVSLLSGNAATALTLAVQLHPFVAVTMLPPTSVSANGGGTIVLGFVARNVGNAPALIHFVGAPATWNFTITPNNVTLGPLGANSTLSGTATVVIPAGTLATPPPVELEPFFANGTSAGSSSSVSVSVAPFISLTAGPFPAGTILGPRSGTIGFYLLNSANVAETVSIIVDNAPELATLGWAAGIERGSSPVIGTTSLASGTNQTFSVTLTAPGGVAYYPSSVEVTATATNASLTATRTLTLPVPQAQLSANSTGLVVTGPGIGAPSAYPDWFVPALAFVPVIAFIAAILVYQWSRTRRWRRR
ncbi:MAG: carboxypeptidase regulatory-like domain-containing protein [Thermoplasmata archaeon]|nr:carboxypeptidase regulatory-like domain-containing protein [Thermoplasmata archaeon]